MNQPDLDLSGAGGSRPRVDLTRCVTEWPTRIKVRRAIWRLLVRPVFMLSPGSANDLRIFLLRLMGAQIGERCLVSAKVDVLMPWNLVLEPFVALGRAVNVYNYGVVTIRRMTLVSQNVHLCTGSHDYTHPHMPLIWKPITIGAECWVASEVFVGPGVTIGDGAVIGARSVVTKNQPEWMVCAGNPCVPLKPRVLRPAGSS